MIRGEVLRVKNLEFIRAEVALGASTKRIIFRHILPNIFANLAIVASYGVALNILIEAGIGFLGFGDPNTITWGLLMQRGFTYLRLEWWGVTFPGLAVFLSVFGFNLLGDGLNNALNPKLGD
jgi:peptide/nickel transport system permease protein